jgi:integrase
MPLTNFACLNAKPKAKSYKLADGGGLYLEVMPSGSKYWRLKYRFTSKEKRLALGVYPTVPLVLARERREVARKQLAESIDPGAVKREQKIKAVLEAATTFEVVAREWHEQQKHGWTPGHANDVMHLLEVDMFPRLAQRPINHITAQELLACLRKIEDRNAGHIARRGRQVCGQVLRYAIVTGRAERNPAVDLQGALRPLRRGHFAALATEDLPEFLRVLGRNDARLHVQTHNAIRLLMLTFVRTAELNAARWAEIDLEAGKWCIPAERMKMRRPHIVPLARQALAILEDQKELTGKREWIFPNRVSPREHMSNGAILMALRRMGYRGRMTGHGFRALATSTIKEELGYRHEVINRQLAHAPSNKVDAAYDRAAFLAERKKMMQDWADFLEKLSREESIPANRATPRKTFSDGDGIRGAFS